ncbi:hypothetical protein ACFL3T_05345 [Patescibacteria group bacterium]
MTDGERFEDLFDDPEKLSAQEGTDDEDTGDTDVHPDEGVRSYIENIAVLEQAPLRKKP